MPLESLCLSVKVCLPHIASIQQALARLLSPPTAQAVAAAVHSLTVGSSTTPKQTCLRNSTLLQALGQHVTGMMPSICTLPHRLSAG